MFFLEKALNKIITSRPDLATECLAMGHKNIVLTLLPMKKASMKISWTISLTNGQFNCAFGMHHDPDLSVSATPRGLMAMILRDDKTMLSMKGDVILAQLLQRCFQCNDINIDWERCFSDIAGESLGYPLLAALRGTRQKVRQIRDHARHRTSDYFQEEIALLPLASEVRDFCDKVDELRLAMDRLEAKEALCSKDKK